MVHKEESEIDDIHRFNICTSSREIFLHNRLDDEDSGVDHYTANCFIKNIRIFESMSSKKPLFVHQYSIGGGWEEAFSIYDAIKTCSIPVVVITHGVAASMGSIIPQAADLIVTMPSCCWMMHDGESSWPNNLRAANSWNQRDKILNKQMYELYTDCCIDSPVFEGKTRSQVERSIRKKITEKVDWFLTAEEAVEYGFCQAIYGSKGYSNLKEIGNHVC